MKPRALLLAIGRVATFSTLNSGLRDETPRLLGCPYLLQVLSVPSTRAYAMKRV